MSEDQKTMQGDWPGGDAKSRARAALNQVIDPMEIDDTERLYCETVLIPALMKEPSPILTPKNHQKIMRVIEWVRGDVKIFDNCESRKIQIPDFCAWVGKDNEDGIPTLLKNIISAPNLTLDMLNQRALSAIQRRQNKMGASKAVSTDWADTKAVQEFPNHDVVLVRCIGPNALYRDAAYLNHCASDSNQDYLSKTTGNDDMQSGMFSLRTCDGKPIATLHVKGGLLEQCAAVNNSPLPLEYLSVIRKIMNDYDWMPDNRGNPRLGIMEGKHDIYSIYDLPADLKLFGDIDISLTTQPITFKNLVLKGTLIMSEHQNPDASPVEGVQATRMAVQCRRNSPNTGPSYFARSMRTGIITDERFYLDHFIGNGMHRYTLPASINRDAVTGEVTHAQWYEMGTKLSRNVIPNEWSSLFNLQEQKKRAIWQETGIWPVSLSQQGHTPRPRSDRQPA